MPDPHGMDVGFQGGMGYAHTRERETQHAFAREYRGGDAYGNNSGTGNGGGGARLPRLLEEHRALQESEKAAEARHYAALWELDVYSSRLLDLQTFLSTTVQNERLRTTSTPTQCQRVAEHLLRDLTERINQDA